MFLKASARTRSARVPSLRRVFVALVLGIGFISSAQGQAGAARARIAADKVLVSARGDQVEASGPSSSGYWLVASDGGVSAFGDAHFYGSTASVTLAKPIVGMAGTPDGKGYWLVASDGGIFAFGDAHFHGSTGVAAPGQPRGRHGRNSRREGNWLVACPDEGSSPSATPISTARPAGCSLANPIVGIAATPDGKGYWLVASDGGVFAFGDAHFNGSTGGLHLANPVVGMAATPDGKGYWLVASDGGIFAFGDAHFYGSTGGVQLANPIVGIAATPDGKGYWLVSSEGRNLAFGNAHYDGSAGGVTLAKPIVGIAATGAHSGLVSLDEIDGDRDLVDVSCPTSGWCMAVDRAGNAINYSGGAWHTPVLVDPGSVEHADLGDGEFDAVSCPTTTFCMAVSSIDGYTIYNGTHWSTIQLPPSGIGMTFHAVSCSSPTFCEAEGGQLRPPGAMGQRNLVGNDRRQDPQGQDRPGPLERVVRTLVDRALLRLRRQLQPLFGVRQRRLGQSGLQALRRGLRPGRRVLLRGRPLRRHRRQR